MKHEAMHARARAVRARALIRSFEYRQRHLASGVWAELRMILAMTRCAYALDDDTARRLESEGMTPLAAGLRIAPPVRLYVVDAARAAELDPEAEIPVRLDDRLLRSGSVALLRFF